MRGLHGGIGGGGVAGGGMGGGVGERGRSPQRRVPCRARGVRERCRLGGGRVSGGVGCRDGDGGANGIVEKLRNDAADDDDVLAILQPIEGGLLLLLRLLLHLIGLHRVGAHAKPRRCLAEAAASEGGASVCDC